jgi:hypothetical protein
MINHLCQITKLKKKFKSTKKKKKEKEKEDENQNKTHMDLIFHFPKNQRILIFQLVNWLQLETTNKLS